MKRQMCKDGKDMDTRTITPHDETSWVRRLRAVILSSIAAGAAVAVVALLGVEIGDTGLKIIGTAFSITGAALVSLPSAAAWERKHLGRLPHAGIASSVAGFALLIAGIWIEPDGEILWKIPSTLIVAGVAIAVMSLLEFARLDPHQHWVLSVTRALVAIVASTLVIAMWGDIGESGYWRGFGVAGVLLAAFLASIPVLHRSSRGARTAEFCPMCGRPHQAPVGDQVVCPHCDTRYRIAA